MEKKQIQIEREGKAMEMKERHRETKERYRVTKYIQRKKKDIDKRKMWGDKRGQKDIGKQKNNIGDIRWTINIGKQESQRDKDKRKNRHKKVIERQKGTKRHWETEE